MLSSLVYRAAHPLLLQKGPKHASKRVLRTFVSLSTLALEKIKGVDVRVGHVLDLNEGGAPVLGIVKKSTKVKPGKGGAFNNLELQQLISGKKVMLRLRSEDNAERISLDKSQIYNLLYKEGDLLNLMHTTTYEQIEVNSSILEGYPETLPFLQDGLENVEIVAFEGDPIICRIPKHVAVGVKYTDEQTKGATSDRGAFKVAELENGLTIQIPPFVQTGEGIVVDTTTREYVSRAETGAKF